MTMEGLATAQRTASPSAPTMLMSRGNAGALGVSQSEPHLLVSDWKPPVDPEVRTCTFLTDAKPPACCVTMEASQRPILKLVNQHPLQPRLLNSQK